MFYVACLAKTEQMRMNGGPGTNWGGSRELNSSLILEIIFQPLGGRNPVVKVEN